MGLIASISSSKGGSGKSTTSINLGVALAKLGKDVTVIDSNLSTPNLSMYLGVPSLPVTLHHVLKGKAHISEAIYKHKSGAKIIPGSISMRDFEDIHLADLKHHLPDLNSEIILLDGAPGIDKEAQHSIKLSNQIIVVAHPELPSVADALKTIRIADRFGVPVRGAVLTRAGHNLDLKIKNVETILEHPVIGIVPEDTHIKKALIKKEAVVYAYPRAPSSLAYTQLAHYLTGTEFNLERISAPFRFLKWAMGMR